MHRAQRHRNKIRQGLLAGLIAASAAGCGGEYLDRRDSISVYAGDAVRSNIVTHVIDPWPRPSANARLTLGAQRMIDAKERKADAPSQSMSPSVTGAGSK